MREAHRCRTPRTDEALAQLLALQAAHFRPPKFANMHDVPFVKSDLQNSMPYSVRTAALLLHAMASLRPSPIEWTAACVRSTSNERGASHRY